MDALRRMVRALRLSTREVERVAGVSAAQLFVMRQLAAAPGQSMRDLAARALTHQSTISEVVGRLVTAGLVQRRTSATDARRAELNLTARGHALVAQAPVTAQQRLVAGFAKLPATRRRALADGLVRWLEAAGLADDTPPPLFFEPKRRRPARATVRA